MKKTLTNRVPSNFKGIYSPTFDKQRHVGYVVDSYIQFDSTFGIDIQKPIPLFPLQIFQFLV